MSDADQYEQMRITQRENVRLRAELSAARAEVERLKYLLTDAQDDAVELANIAINEHRRDRALWYQMRAKAIAEALAPKEKP